MSSFVRFLERFDWLGHIVEAAMICAVIAVAFWPVFGLEGGLVVGGFFAVGHFHGREKRDYEVSEHMKPPHLAGYKIWLWSWDQKTDFLPVLAVFLVIFIVWRLL